MTIELLLYAMMMQESGGRSHAIGDGGASRGILQIKKEYWIDARMPYGTYLDVHKPAYAKEVVRRYMKRYEPKAYARCDVEVLTRLHNSGPQWRNKIKATNEYVNKVKSKMKGKVK